MKMKMNRYGFFALLCLSLSCNDVPQKNIAGLDYNLWKVKNLGDSIRGVATYYYFDNKGKWDIYVKYKNAEEIKEYDMHDIDLIKNWQLINDSAFNMGGKLYKINILSQEKFVLLDPTDNDTITLTKTKKRL